MPCCWAARLGAYDRARRRSDDRLPVAQIALQLSRIRTGSAAALVINSSWARCALPSLACTGCRLSERGGNDRTEFGAWVNASLLRNERSSAQRLSARRGASSSASRARPATPPCWEAANGQKPRWAHRSSGVGSSHNGGKGQTLMTAREVVSAVVVRRRWSGRGAGSVLSPCRRRL
jgi:hypothetical protein